MESVRMLSAPEPRVMAFSDCFTCHPQYHASRRAEQSASIREKRNGSELEAGDGRAEGNGPQRFRRGEGRLLRRGGPGRRIRLEDVPRHAIELEASELFRAAAGPALFGGARGHPGRLR